MQNNLPKYILTKENSLREDPAGNITFVAQAMEVINLHSADAKTAWAECEALREKVAALEVALSAAEPVKTPFKVASAHIPEAHVSLLSRVIRQGLNDYGWKNFGTIPEVLAGYIIRAETAEAEAHPKQPASSVAVKALEWETEGDPAFWWFADQYKIERLPHGQFRLSRTDMRQIPTEEADKMLSERISKQEGGE